MQERPAAGEGPRKRWQRWRRPGPEELPEHLRESARTAGELSVALGDETEILQFSDMEIPTVPEVERWVAALEQVPAEGPADVTTVVDYALRFAALAFRRNPRTLRSMAVLAAKSANRSSGEVDAVMLH